jgi:hypothetical protein
VINHQAVQLALRNQAIPALPALREWENVAFTPTAGQPFVEEDYVPAGSTLRGLVLAGMVEDTALYVIRWYGLAGQGTKAINDGITALLARFAPGTAILASDGSIVRVRGDVAPIRSQITNTDDGAWAVTTVTIPVRVFTQNAA